MREAVEDAIDAKLIPLLAEPTERPQQYLTTEEAAEVARVKTDTMRDWLKAGRLQRHGTTRHLLVRRDQLESFLDAGVEDKEPLASLCFDAADGTIPVAPLVAELAVQTDAPLSPGFLFARHAGKAQARIKPNCNIDPRHIQFLIYSK